MLSIPQRDELIPGLTDVVAMETPCAGAHHPKMKM